MTKVSLLECKSYSLELLKDKIEESLKNIDIDLSSFKNKKIAVKPNLLSAFPPEKAIVTQPEFFHAVVKIVKENGGIPILIENPAVFPLEKVIKKAGFVPVIEEEKIEIADVVETMKLEYEGARKYKTFDISKDFFDVDIIISLPRLKTHSLTYMTCAVKNLFGSIPGMIKARSHMRAKTTEEFAHFLLDLYSSILYGFDKPKQIIHIADAVIGMEGEGPGTKGKPKEIGAIICGTDAIAVDFIGANLVCLDVNKINTIIAGEERNLGKASFQDIDLVGDSIDTLKIEDFEPPSENVSYGLINWFFSSQVFRNLFIEKPVPVEKQCILCYQCEKICPAKAISKADKKKKIPVYDYKKCIRCFCCMEICPEAAIEKRRGPLQWMLTSPFTK
jgi:uncharacterized protein (DUF362 family)/Pyruvate/2-oxoacid:ferredoxin oxidoreductase delta subunit